MTAVPSINEPRQHPHAPLHHLSSRRRSSANFPAPSPLPASGFSTYSVLARHVLMNKLTLPVLEHAQSKSLSSGAPPRSALPLPQPALPLSAQPKSVQQLKDRAAHYGQVKPPPIPISPPPQNGLSVARDGVGNALSDTPLPSHPSSPRESATATPRLRPTTLDIPGLTKSKVSPDGKIAQRDVGSKLVIIMVGLPARGKSYITKKMARYLNWLQHDTKIFNVGEKRRVAASELGYRHSQASSEKVASSGKDTQSLSNPSLPQVAATILINGESNDSGSLNPLRLPEPLQDNDNKQNGAPEEEAMDQSANFFDPSNKKAAQIREQCAMETLDDLLDYILKGNGSVGIFDATNSTLARRKQIMDHIRKRAGPELNILFVESLCRDQQLLESNMRLKLSGPDYQDKDPIAALEDFKKRVAIYEKNYIPLGDYEEDNNMPYVKMVDVGRKMISHQVKGFLAGQAVYYLLNFNLAPRMIWITRHGESLDNVAGKIGGDSDLSDNGRKYAQAMTRFINRQRKEWAVRQADKMANTHFPPAPGDHTPPNPYYSHDLDQHNFCVWTSMLKRSVHSGQYFCDEDFEVKQMRMLDELNAGIMEGLTYNEIRTQYAEEYSRRRQDKLAYRYPGPGGEGYLDVINRIRPVIVELERMTDHCLLITHRSVARVLLAYFQGLNRENVADLDCPLGMLYQLEPKPYGVEFKAWRYNPKMDDFDHLPDYKLKREPIVSNSIEQHTV